MSDAAPDPRAAVLGLLARHAALALDPREAEMVAAVRAFVAARPGCLWRTEAEGHLTGSAWVVDPARARALLVHHRKLDRWLQPGGHADGDPDLLAVARREAEEETGLRRLRVVSAELFDVDRHWIPARGDTPGHWHLDCRFLLEADPAERPAASEESHDVRWFDLAEIAAVEPSESLARLVRKTQAGFPGAGQR